MISASREAKKVSANIIGARDGLGVGESVFLLAEGDGAHQEEHIARDETGVLKSLFVSFDLALAATEAVVPVATRGDGHLIDRIVFVKDVEGRHRARPSRHGERGADLHAEIAVRAHEEAIQEADHAAVRGGVVDGRGDDHAVRLGEFLREEGEVAPERAFSFFRARTARDAATHVLRADLVEDALHTRFFEDADRFFEETSAVAVFAGTAVDE